jgi:hypothetical protein
MQSLKSSILYDVVRSQLAKLAQSGLPLPEYRLAREEVAKRIFKVPAGISIQAASVKGCSGEWLCPANAVSQGIVMYLHGAPIPVALALRIAR